MAAKEVQGDRAGGDSKLLRELTGKYDNVENFEFPLSITLGGSKMGGLPHFSEGLFQRVHISFFKKNLVPMLRMHFLAIVPSWFR